MNNNLHMHTNISPCTKQDITWQKLLTDAQNLGLDRIAITDHDNCLFNLITLYQSPKQFFSGTIVPGMECDVTHNGLSFEILAYNFDIIKGFNWAYETYGTLFSRQSKMKDTLLEIAQKKGILVDTTSPFENGMYAHDYVYNGIKKLNPSPKFFEEFNINTSSDFYRASTGNKDFPLYANFDFVFPNIKTVVDGIHNIGGVAILAHPYNYKNIPASLLLNFVKEFNLDGIEVYHPSCTNENIDELINFAKEYNLIITGGTDYHAKEGRNDLVIKNIDKDQKFINL